MLYEFRVIHRLGTSSNVFLKLAGISKLYWAGTEGEYNIMVMELLGPSLEDLFVSYHQKFSLKTVLMLADQMVI